MDAILEIKGLKKDYADFQLSDLNLSIAPGTITGLVGANGAGKSTTIKLILNLIHRDAGSIRIFGMDNLEQETAVKERIGVVFDEPCFHDILTPVQISGYMGGLYPRWDAGRFQHYLKDFGLPDKKTIKDFSRGMKMKLSLAAALAHHPKLLILDEATAGLDPVVRDEILDEFLNFIQDEEHSILISSHITSDLEKVADYITYLHQGKVVLSEAKDVIQDSYGRLGCTAADLLTVDSKDLVRVRKGSYGCEALVSDRAAFRKKYPQLMVEPISLEDIMLFIGKGESV